MPHVIKEKHLDDLCSSCKKPHGGNFEIFHQHHKIYEIITCSNCGYEIIRVKSDTAVTDRFDMR